MDIHDKNRQQRAHRFWTYMYQVKVLPSRVRGRAGIDAARERCFFELFAVLRFRST